MAAPKGPEGCTLSSADVRFGSKADSEARQSDVCFTPKSGHRETPLGCPLCAKSGLLAIDGIANCACHRTADASASAAWWEPNDAATLWEHQIASDAMSLDA
jgi:hypothetical protein